MIGSLFVGKLLAILGRKVILITGIISMGICMVSFSLIDYFSNKVMIIIACIIIRSLQGVSSSMIQTTSYAIVTACYPQDQQKFLGYIETSVGIG
mmetsp:Transcript_4593/g.3863  ORF Transcript_4593/g.3863 Transcript_4593/m.3863 type:complete len:95 (+) Transcript_4593:155-439(+)